jgi:hypothetical protein
MRSKLSLIAAVLPAARAQDLQRQLPGLTGGEGVPDSTFAGYQPVNGHSPTRRQLPVATGAGTDTVSRPPSP